VSFNVLCQGLLKLPFEKNFSCLPCCHGKMVAASILPINLVLTKQPGEFLLLDIIGPSRVRSVVCK
jgi:hypothetical protein